MFVIIADQNYMELILPSEAQNLVYEETRKKQA